MLMVALAHADVRLSSSGICHPEDSKWYAKTSDKVTYPDIASCLQAGGRLPKGYTPSVKEQVKQATDEAIAQGRSFVPLYQREDYPHWSDADNDCQNTRQEVLIATSQIPVKFTNAKKCTVKTGQWYDPYTGKTWTASSDVDIDHIVPLKAAHDRGAYAWSQARKEQFANDPINLIAVEDNVNQAKGAKMPAEWMPPNHAYRCTYLAQVNHVMATYELAYLPKEKRVIERMRVACRQ